MENSDNKKSAPQRTLQNASKLNTYQINQYIYSNPRKGIWQRVKEAINHE
ncbi:hypothetical protein FAM21834_02122 [Lentilactobacillus parabuchneri]|uniref:Uncharacterized protein n=1 Tax=Lentilactobacillus parabuchneri TaxID=152331 RepID=A0A1X1FCL1_9LACO|nr:hypothetical protein FAM21829_02034 [Lentilactobacillus parabuchneri]ORN06477.1 hypothetical protein FAM21834_02122 [Lentilactobacillus parabuchneri]ORN26185.1 hypothetical protein FAM23169_02085 [Lentilactobacillus parabuchneri]